MIAQLLGRVGVLYRWRAGMRIALAPLSEPPRLPEGYEIAPWDPERLPEVALVDYRAYRDTIDGVLYRAYFATAEGCARMWQESLNGRFGRFDTERTLLLTRDGSVCGDVMAVQTGPTDGFIGNLAVDPQHRGGTGRALLLACLWKYKEAGFQHVSLAVTYENERAFRLYRSLGFQVTGRFPIFTRRPAPARSVQC